MSFNSLISPGWSSRFCRLCKSPTNPFNSIRNPLRIGLTLSMENSSTLHSSQYASFSSINTFHQVTSSSSDSSKKLSSLGILNSETHLGFASILSRPDLSNSGDHEELTEDLSTIESEKDVRLKPFSIRITEAAARRIRYIKQVDQNPSLVLRLAVESGGCHGFQYKMNFTDSIESDDYVFSIQDESIGLVAIDSGSLQLMNGSTLDFATELIGSSFRILDNPNAAGPGCGCGVSWELK